MKNVEKLIARFRKMPQAVQIAARAEMEKQATKIVSLMKSVAPVLKQPDARRRAGALKDSIGWTWGDAPKGSVSLGSVSGGSGLVITIYAGSSNGADDAFYARWIEFGTVKMQAQPFFYPSVRIGKRGFVAAINRAAIKEMRKVWG